jgi:hypothetical protein
MRALLFPKTKIRRRSAKNQSLDHQSFNEGNDQATGMLSLVSVSAK